MSSAGAPTRPRLVMAMKVRDEADIIGANLRFHHGLGVDHFIITDNKSSDGTSEVLARYSDAGLATVIRSDSDDFRHEAIRWVQRMARLAATEHGADWVINADADEFWLPAYGNLHEVLAQIPPQYGAVLAPRTEVVGRADGPPDFAERLTIREARSHLRPNVAHRGDPSVISLDRGGHNVASEHDDPVPRHGSERAVLRGGRRHAGPGRGDMTFTWAPRWPIRVLHFPVRSLEQIRRRTEVLLYEGGFPEGGARDRLRQRYEAGEIESIHGELVLDEEAIAAGIRDGELVRDERFRDLLASCPDPLAAPASPAGSVRVPDAPETRAGELADLELDAMTAITRFQYRLTMNKKRFERRTRELEGELAELRREAEVEPRARRRRAR